MRSLACSGSSLVRARTNSVAIAARIDTDDRAISGNGTERYIPDVLGLQAQWCRKLHSTLQIGFASWRVVGDPEIITRPPCWDLRSASPNEMTPWLGLKLEGLHYAQTGVIQQDLDG